ncbi:hypothetical protein PRIPAC_70540, partial [Pristionchus pacificus]|uniref:G protein-coupled receptor n=1 Tax=Pristionchus pacificus TaxID=54126 RepID=A0A2A6CRF4_PRIPA
EMLTLNDRIHLSVLWTVDGLAIMANIFLIIAIILKTPKALASYSLLLLNNALLDLASATSSAKGAVRVVQDHPNFSMIFVFIGPCSIIDEHLCRMCLALHGHLVQLSTIILFLSFGYRLYILGDIFPMRTLTPIHIVLSILLITPQTMEYYVEQADVSTESVLLLNLSNYTASTSSIIGSTRAIFLNGSFVFLSPVVMTSIFIVRRKLLKKMAISALTYQSLLPVGMGVAVSLWLCDVIQLWSSEFLERFVMIAASVFSLASPLINFLVLPPYRAVLPFSKKTKPTTQLMDFTSVTI